MSKKPGWFSRWFGICRFPVPTPVIRTFLLGLAFAGLPQSSPAAPPQAIPPASHATATPRQKTEGVAEGDLATITPLGVPDAMRMLYGNYDARTRSSRVAVAETNGNKLGHDHTQNMIAQPAFHAGFDEAGVKKLVLLTYAIPKGAGFSCHACAPTIGMALFSNTGLAPTIEAANQAIV